MNIFFLFKTVVNVSGLMNKGLKSGIVDNIV